MASRAIDTVITFRVLKLLTMKWTDHEAYKIGIIDKKGKRNKEVDIDTKEKKEAYTFLHRLVFNLKRLIELLPGGKSRLGSYASALFLIKEHCELTGTQLDKEIFKYLQEADLLEAAVQKVLDDGLRTKDILSPGKKEVSTSEMGDAIIAKLK